jgi:hypothetical protein
MFKFKFLVHKFVCVDNFVVGPKYFTFFLKEKKIQAYLR